MTGRPSRSPIPPALIVAGLVGLVGTVVNLLLAFALKLELTVPHMFWLDTIAEGVRWAVCVLLAAALVDIADRSTGGLRGWLALGAVLPILTVVVGGIIQVERVVDLRELGFEGILYTVCAILGRTGLSLAILFAAVAARRGRVLALLGVLASVANGTTPWLAASLRHHVGESPLKYVFGIAYLAWLGFTITTLMQIALARPVLESPNAAARGYGRIGLGLMVQIIAPLLLVMTGPAGRTPTALHVILGLGVTALVGSWGLVGSGLLDVMRSALPGLAGGRLAVALACFATAAGVRLDQVVQLAQRFAQSPRYDAVPADRGAITVPVVSFLAFALIGSAIASLAKERGDTRIANMAWSRTLAFVFVQLGLLVLGLLIEIDHASLDTSLVFGICSTVVTIAMTVSYANLMHQTSESMKRGSFLPSARLL